MGFSHLVISYIAMENHHAIQFGKPSISMDHFHPYIYQGYVSHNQRVDIKTYLGPKKCLHNHGRVNPYQLFHGYVCMYTLPSFISNTAPKSMVDVKNSQEIWDQTMGMFNIKGMGFKDT